MNRIEAISTADQSWSASGGLETVSKWSQFYFVPGMSHCAGGQALDQFDLLGAMVNWVEEGIEPQSVIATGKVFPGRSRPLCAKMCRAILLRNTHTATVCRTRTVPAHYKGQGDTQDANNFECR